MAAHSDSRPSTEVSPAARASEPGSSTTWNPYLSNPDLRSFNEGAFDEGGSREAIPPPVAAGKTAASMPQGETNKMLATLNSLTESVKESVRDGMSKEAVVDTVKKFTKAMQKTVAKLGGVDVPEGRTSLVPGSDVATGRFSMPARNSLSPSLDGYRPDRDVVAPISVRPNAMELLWVCGDCGQHYPRARECPERCTECGAPKQHFYAPIED